jgi:putative transposase
VARRGLAGARKKSHDENGVIVLADEVGFLMNPCVKATWAPVGQTPVVPHRNRHYKKVSALGALAVRGPDRNVELLIDWYPDGYVRGVEAAAFVERLLKHFPRGPIDLVWDNLQAHKSPLIKQLVNEHPRRLRVHYLPPYAPDLNPVESLWSIVKYHRMANHAIDDVIELQAEAQRHVANVAAEQRLLRSCFQSARLALY